MFSSTHNRKDLSCFVFSPTGLRRSKLRPYTSWPPLPRLFASTAAGDGFGNDEAL
jgi:hypothetical protein